MTNKSTLSIYLDELFGRLDAARISENVIFESKKDKDYYETLVMFAFRKLQAARHHLQNIYRFNDSTYEELNSFMLSDLGQIDLGSKLHVLETHINVRHTANEYSFELSACLTAIKSSLDFIARVCALQLSGIEADSIRTLVRLVEKGQKTGPILDEVAEKLIWIKELRNYRDYLVHRLCIVPTSGWAMETVEGQVVKQIFPVLVPHRTPKFVMDTRSARLIEEKSDSELIESRSETWVTNRNGTRVLLGHSISYESAPGFSKVDELMRYHISELEKFFERIVLRLIDLEFKSVSLS